MKREKNHIKRNESHTGLKRLGCDTAKGVVLNVIKRESVCVVSSFHTTITVTLTDQWKDTQKHKHIQREAKEEEIMR